MTKLLDAARDLLTELERKAKEDDPFARLNTPLMRTARAAIAEEEAKHEDGTHSCGYFCQRPACVLAQRDGLGAQLRETNQRLFDALKARNEAQAERNELRAKLAALEAAGGEPVAWRTFDGEGGYDYRTYDDNEDYCDDWIKRNGQRYAEWVTPLYTHPAPAYVPMTDEETKQALFDAGVHEFSENSRQTDLFIFRSGEQAVLRRLGVSK